MDRTYELTHHRSSQRSTLWGVRCAWPASHRVDLRQTIPTQGRQAYARSRPIRSDFRRIDCSLPTVPNALASKLLLKSDLQPKARSTGADLLKSDLADPKRKGAGDREVTSYDRVRVYEDTLRRCVSWRPPAKVRSSHRR